MKPLASGSAPPAQRRFEPEKEEEEENLQAKSDQTPHATPEIEVKMDKLGAGGQPLTDPVRAFFEPRFEYDFSRVRVHMDAEAAESARAVRASAYTVGSDIVFGKGQYDPMTMRGSGLLAHELTHVVQNRVREGIEPVSRIQCAPETWYRGEALGVGPASPGSVPHDLGDGLYLTDREDIARLYAVTRVGDKATEGRVLSANFERSSLGRVLDLTTDARWQKLMKTSAPGGQTYEELIEMVNENYGRFFQKFVKEHNIKLEDYDAIIGPEYARGGKQVCIRNATLASKIKALFTVQQTGIVKPPQPAAAGPGKSAVPAASKTGQPEVTTGTAVPKPAVRSVQVPKPKGLSRLKLSRIRLRGGLGTAGAAGAGILISLLVGWIQAKREEEQIESDLEELSPEIEERIEALSPDMNVFLDEAPGAELFANITVEISYSTSPDPDWEGSYTTYMGLKLISVKWSEDKIEEQKVDRFERYYFDRYEYIRATFSLPLSMESTEEETGGETEETGPLIQRRAYDGQETIFASDDVDAGVRDLEGRGRPLPENIREYMEPRFGVDFSRVRIHTDEDAAKTALSVDARAFTLGRDIVFGAGQYDSTSASGKRLLAHELSHVVQQQYAPDRIRRQDQPGPESNLEKPSSAQESIPPEKISKVKINIEADTVSWADPDIKHTCTGLFTGGGWYRPHGIVSDDTFEALPDMVLLYDEKQNQMTIRDVKIHAIINLNDPVEEAYPIYKETDEHKNNVFNCVRLGPRDLEGRGHYEDVIKELKKYGDASRLEGMLWWVKGSTLQHELVHQRLFRETFEKEWKDTRKKWAEELREALGTEGKREPTKEIVQKSLAKITHQPTGEEIPYEETKSKYWDKEIGEIGSFFHGKPEKCPPVKKAGTEQFEKSLEGGEKGEEDPDAWRDEPPDTERKNRPGERKKEEPLDDLRDDLIQRKVLTGQPYPVLRRASTAGGSRQKHAEKELDRMAERPREALGGWNQLDPAEQSTVIEKMTKRYGDRFVTQFREYASGRLGAQMAVEVTNRFTPMPKELRDRGFALAAESHKDIEIWVHPSGKESWRIRKSETTTGLTSTEEVHGQLRRSRDEASIGEWRGRVEEYEDGTLLLYPRGVDSPVQFSPIQGDRWNAYNFYDQDGRPMKKIYFIPPERLWGEIPEMNQPGQ